MADWQPIETAPRDGAHVLVFKSGLKPWVDRQLLPPFCEQPRNGMPVNGQAFCGNPTHWMPLPKPPTA